MERLLPLDREHLRRRRKGWADPKASRVPVPVSRTVFNAAPIYMPA